MNFAYIVPTALLVALAMLAAHWSPVFEGSHALPRYAWGVGWLFTATAGHVVLDVQAPAWTTLAVFALMIVAAASGTGAGYLYDKVKKQDAELGRRDGRQG